MVDAPIAHFDAQGLGQEPNNLAALDSLTGYRAMRWGRHVELIITDQRSYRSEEPTAARKRKAFASKDFPELFPQEALEILDAGRAYNGGKPRRRFGIGARRFRISAAESRRRPFSAPNRNMVSGPPEKLDSDLEGLGQHHRNTRLPCGSAKPTAGTHETLARRGLRGIRQWRPQHRLCRAGEIYYFVRDEGITGFATIAGDRHSFWAGLAAKNLPPKAFEPVGVAYIVGSISAPGLVEAFEHKFPKSIRCVRSTLARGPRIPDPQPTINMLLRHGVRSCLEYARKAAILTKARALSNPDLAPHLSFVDMGGHGYAVVRVTGDHLETEFVCIPRPLERSERADGGPLLYRARYRADLWRSGEKPSLQGKIVEGDPKFSV